MKRLQTMSVRRALGAGVAVTALACGQAANAQDAEESEEVIVVTGTLIQGIDPVGTNVIGITAADVEELGSSNATEVLRRLPQVSDFGTLPQPTTDSSIPFSPIQLRGLGGLSGMTTLILLDGKRIVPSSIANWTDTQMIPAGVIERMEVIPDGGSSIYGSDAIGGVINIVTKRKADGISLDANYGIGENGYDFWNATATAGTSWDSGSAILSYSYSDRDALLGSRLDYLIEDKTALGGQDTRSVSCDPGNITVAGTSFALPGLRTGTSNFCSSDDERAFFPDEEHHAVFGTLTQEFAAGVELQVNAFWSRRETTVTDPDNVRSSGTVTDANPFFMPIGTETSHDIAFSLENVLGPARGNDAAYEAWQISPTLTFDVVEGWTLRAGLNYGESDNRFLTNRINGEAQAAALASTDPAAALNPYDPSTTNPAVIAAIADFIEDDFAHQEIFEARLVADGILLELPAGDVRLAAGAEYRHEVYNRFRTDGVSASPVTVADLQSDRDVYSVFGELYVPVIAGLEVSLAARLDEYSDVGTTVNPKFGFTYEPADWVRLRGSWGTSFHAPALADLTAPLGFELFLPISPIRPAGSPFFPDFFRPTFLLAGAAPGIKPETATTWSIGGDFTPEEQLRLGLTYWNIDFEDRIDQNAGFFFGPAFFDDPANADFFIINPTTPQDVIDKFGDFPALGFPSLAAMFNIFGAPFLVNDQRKQNLGELEIDGIDVNLDYRMDLGGGALDLSGNASYILNRDKETVPGAGFENTLRLGDFSRPTSRFTGTASVGWGGGPLYLSTTLNHRGSANVLPEEIGSYTTLALFGRYRLTEFLSLSVNVDNLFDQAPPLRASVDEGRAFLDYGRIVKFGLNLGF